MFTRENIKGSSNIKMKYRIQSFFILDFNISFISRDSNQLEDSLVIEGSTLKAPLNPRLVHEVQMRHRPASPYNIKH